MPDGETVKGKLHFYENYTKIKDLKSVCKFFDSGAVRIVDNVDKSVYNWFLLKMREN